MQLFSNAFSVKHLLQEQNVFENTMYVNETDFSNTWVILENSTCIDFINKQISVFYFFFYM